MEIFRDFNDNDLTFVFTRSGIMGLDWKLENGGVQNRFINWRDVCGYICGWARANYIEYTGAD